MSEKRVVMVVDMQNGVFETPRHQREKCVSLINQLTQAADTVIFIQHTEAGGLEEGSEGFALLPELHQPADALYVTKTACDAFYNTGLEALLREQGIREFVICGCATDFCVDTTLRSAAARGFDAFAVTDAHTTADRPHLSAEQIIQHHHFMWRHLSLPQGRSVTLLTTDELLATI